MKDTIEIQKSWLRTLYSLSEECREAQDKWFEAEKPLMPLCFSKLIGFASSADTFLQTDTEDNCICTTPNWAKCKSNNEKHDRKQST